MNAPAQLAPGGWWEFPRIGETADFMDANGNRFHGRVIAIVNGLTYAAVLGYATAFPLLPVTPQQAAFVLEDERLKAGGAA
jgi:hypothetical protein